MEQLLANFATLGFLSLLNGCSSSDTTTNIQFILTINKPPDADCSYITTYVNIYRIIPLGGTTTKRELHTKVNLKSVIPDKIVTVTGSLTFYNSEINFVQGETTEFEYFVSNSKGKNFTKSVYKQVNLKELPDVINETIEINCQSPGESDS